MPTSSTNQKQTRADNGNDHRAGTIDLNIEKHAKSGFACIVLLSSAHTIDLDSVSKQYDRVQ